MCHKCGGQVNPTYDFNYCGSSQVSPAYDMGDGKGYKGSAFVLIVVLFILLIIVGKCYM
ncbi:YjcZ family sporulation protein [Ureibacillus sp. 179-F W5.1 NHS]